MEGRFVFWLPDGSVTRCAVLVEDCPRQATTAGELDIVGCRARINSPDGPGQPTAAKCYRLLRAIMQTATEDGRVAKNPCSIRSAGREEPVERPMITLEQLDAITAAAGERCGA
jgi:hypothetical protein